VLIRLAGKKVMQHLCESWRI